MCDLPMPFFPPWKHCQNTRRKRKFWKLILLYKKGRILLHHYYYYACTILACCITKRHQDSCTCHRIMNHNTILSCSSLIGAQKHIHMGGIKQNEVSTNSKVTSCKYLNRFLIWNSLGNKNILLHHMISLSNWTLVPGAHVSPPRPQLCC